MLSEPEVLSILLERRSSDMVGVTAESRAGRRGTERNFQESDQTPYIKLFSRLAHFATHYFDLPKSRFGAKLTPQWKIELEAVLPMYRRRLIRNERNLYT